jgi:intracellular sulfur oxidation DsrE/DsrF family protein
LNPWSTDGERRVFDPNAPLERELQSVGITVMLCAKAMKEQGWTKKDVLPWVRVIPGALPRVIDLQQHGYADLRFWRGGGF